MAKYPISKEFFPFNLFAPPMSKKFVLLAQKHMKTPKLLWQDPELDVQTRTIPGYQGSEIEIYLIQLHPGRSGHLFGTQAADVREVGCRRVVAVKGHTVADGGSQPRTDLEAMCLYVFLIFAEHFAFRAPHFLAAEDSACGQKHEIDLGNTELLDQLLLLLLCPFSVIDGDPYLIHKAPPKDHIQFIVSYRA